MKYYDFSNHPGWVRWVTELSPEEAEGISVGVVVSTVVIVIATVVRWLL